MRFCVMVRYNVGGLIGRDGTTTMQRIPVAVSGISDAIQVSVGGSGSEFTCALLSSKIVQCWGLTATVN